MIQKVATLLKNLQADKKAKISLKSVKLLQKRLGDSAFKCNAHENIVTGSLHSSIPEEKVQKINQQLSQLGIQGELQTGFETGGLFKDYGEFQNVFDDGKTKLAHTPNEVLLVDVWATWCGPCQKPMKHNQEMLEKNQEAWKGKAKIVGVSVDNEKEVIKKRVVERKWEKVTHLTLLGWNNDHPLIKDFKIQGIPFVCLVNKWGKVDFVGHPSEINLQVRINQLIKQTEDKSLLPQASAVQSKSQNSKEQNQKIKKLLDKESIQKQFETINFAIFKCLEEDKYQNDTYSTHFSVVAHVIDGDQAAEAKVRQLFKQFQSLQLKLQKVPYVDVPQNDSPDCSLCPATKLSYPFYWLKWQGDNKFGCRACVEKKSAIPEHHYHYEKNSILLFGNWSKVGQKHIGKNLQPGSPNEVEDSFNFGCNGCGGCSENIGNARYICLGCRSDPNFQAGGWVDVCDVCANKLCEKNEQVLSNLAPDGHHPNHPLLRLLYNVKGYYDY